MITRKTSFLSINISACPPDRQMVRLPVAEQAGRGPGPRGVGRAAHQIASRNCHACPLRDAAQSAPLSGVTI
jgi:hypothetical protein